MPRKAMLAFQNVKSKYELLRSDSRLLLESLFMILLLPGKQISQRRKQLTSKYWEKSFRRKSVKILQLLNQRRQKTKGSYILMSIPAPDLEC